MLQTAYLYLILYTIFKQIDSRFKKLYQTQGENFSLVATAQQTEKKKQGNPNTAILKKHTEYNMNKQQ